MTELSNANGLEFVLSQIKNPIDRAEALFELASRGVYIPKEIALEYVTYILLGKNGSDVNLNKASIFSSYTGLTELAELIWIRVGSRLKYENEQRYLDAVR